MAGSLSPVISFVSPPRRAVVSPSSRHHGHVVPGRCLPVGAGNLRQSRPAKFSLEVREVLLLQRRPRPAAVQVRQPVRGREGRGGDYTLHCQGRLPPWLPSPLDKSAGESKCCFWHFSSSSRSSSSSCLLARAYARCGKEEKGIFLKRENSTEFHGRSPPWQCSPSPSGPCPSSCCRWRRGGGERGCRRGRGWPPLPPRRCGSKRRSAVPEDCAATDNNLDRRPGSGKVWRRITVA